MAVAAKNTKKTTDEPVVETEVTKETVSEVKTEPVKVEEKKPRVFNQTDPILCRSVCPGWLGMPGKSGQYYVWANYGDETEVEYQDLFAMKSSHSAYIYDPLFIIEDEELLENPRWKDVLEFYNDKLYGADNVEEILNVPVNKFKKTLENLPKGMIKAIAVRVATKIEDGSFDSIKKIKIVDEVCGTDFWNLTQS